MTPLTVEGFVGSERQATGKDVLALAQEHGVRMVDFKFTDLPGTWQHLGLSIHSLDEEAFDEGLGFDGSSAGASKITGDVTQIMAELPEVLEALTGMKLGDIAKRVPGVKNGDDGDAVDGDAEEIR